MRKVGLRGVAGNSRHCWAALSSSDCERDESVCVCVCERERERERERECTEKREIEAGWKGRGRAAHGGCL
jgi:hypothetical protein